MPSFLSSALHFLIKRDYLILLPYDRSLLDHPRYVQFKRKQSYGSSVAPQINQPTYTKLTLFNGWTIYACAHKSDQERQANQEKRFEQLENISEYLESCDEKSGVQEKNTNQEIYVPILFKAHSPITGVYERETSYCILKIEISDNGIFINVYDPTGDSKKFEIFISDLVKFSATKIKVNNPSITPCVQYVSINNNTRTAAQYAEIGAALMLGGVSSPIQPMKSLKEYESQDLFLMTKEKNTAALVLQSRKKDDLKTNKKEKKTSTTVSISAKQKSNHPIQSSYNYELNVIPTLDRIRAEQTEKKDNHWQRKHKSPNVSVATNKSINSNRNTLFQKQKSLSIKVTKNAKEIKASSNSTTLFKKIKVDSLGLEKIPIAEFSMFCVYINKLIDEVNSFFYKNKVRKILKILVLKKIHLSCRGQELCDLKTCLKEVIQDVHNGNLETLSSYYYKKIKDFFAEENEEKLLQKLQAEILIGRRTKQLFEVAEISTDVIEMSYPEIMMDL